jgi:hypothetical protein
MTAIKLPDALVKALHDHDVQDIETFVSEAAWKQLREDDEKEHYMCDAETLFGKSEPIPTDMMERILAGVGQPGNDEGSMEMGEFRALRRVERAEARANMKPQKYDSTL